MTTKREAKVLYLAVELFLWELDHVPAPTWATNGQREGWDKALAHVRSMAAEGALRICARKFVQSIRDELTPAEWGHISSNFAAISSGREG